MSKIVRNALLNGLALASTSALSLVLVPVLIRHYGLDAYGLLPLLRLFTPLGALGIAALGLPQLATRAAAMHHARGEQEELLRSQSTLVAGSAALGVVFAILLLSVGADRFAIWLNVTAADKHAFAQAFGAALVLLPLLMAGVVVHASLSGLGRFRLLRSTEVGVYLLYFVAALGAVFGHAPVVFVVLAMLASDALRSLAFLTYARQFRLIGIRRVFVPDLTWLATQKTDFTLISASSLLGYTRKFLPATSIPLVFGPAALGVYDAIERVPRALKTLLGLVSTSSLPHALKLDAAADKALLRSLLVRGTRLTLLCMLPACATIMVYAQPIVSVWLGQHLAYGGAFLVLLMVPFVVDATLSIIGTATLARLELVSQQAKVTILEIVVFLLVMVGLVPLASGSAPYAATAVAAALGFGLRLHAFLPAYGIALPAWLWLLAKISGGSMLGAVGVYALSRITGASDWLVLLTAPIAVIAGTGLVVWAWSADERRDLKNVAESMRDLLARRALR